jgi:Flp pilus assembly protein TadD
MFRHAATAFVIAAALSGCAGNPFDGLARTHAVDENPEKPEAAKVAALVRVADATAAAGDLPSATAMYRRAHALDPADAAVQKRLADTLLRLGETDEAAKLFRSAAARGDDAEALRGYARALIALDQPQAAVSQLQAALRLAESPGTYNLLGVAHDFLGDHGAAQAYYRTGLDVEPGSLALQNNLGLSLAVAGRFAEAISVLRKAAAGSAATARQRLNLALAYGLAGERETAAATARIDLDERSVQQNLAFYDTLRALGDSRETIRAIGAHNAALRIRGEDGGAGGQKAAH